MKSLVTLSELFSDRIFRIPDYQRGYAWQEDQLRYFLYEYENYLYENAGRKEQRPADWRQAVKGYYSIEHIYPQTPQDWYWLNQFRDYSEDEKSICTKTLGNMLLLSKDINSALQNHSYPRKCQPLNKERTGYIDGSFSEREVAKTYKDWNPDSIYKRTMVLIKFFKTRWGVSFNTAQKEVLSGMSFMSKERVLSNELFNHNTFTDTLKSTFEANGYLVNIESRYIQFMKPDWVFNDNTHIHSF